ncbi:MAG: alanine racemase [Gammaproteobacteria bacterium]|nr:alanine racemase [Gammaproteobacteria bacterium]
MTRPARARIDLQNLQHNFSCVRESAPASQVMAIIKANAYGHGLVRVAQALRAADALGVVGLKEAITLREAGCDQRIVLLEGLFSADDIALINGYHLDVVIHHRNQLELLEQGRLARPLDIWLKVDTGMHRLGFAPTDVDAVVERLMALPHAGTLRLMTHFASADEPDSTSTTEQIGRFAEVGRGMTAERTLANSAAILAWPDSHADWVRPGIMLYGGSPFTGRDAQSLGLKPVMTLRSELIAVNAHRKGDAIGYGGSWTCSKDMNIGVAAIGYGDGYPRHAPSGTPVLVNGQRAQLAGRVSMDMICIDLGEQPAAVVGDEVILWGGGLPVDEVAALAGTLSYELLCGVSARVCYDYC